MQKPKIKFVVLFPMKHFFIEKTPQDRTILQIVQAFIDRRLEVKHHNFITPRSSMPLSAVMVSYEYIIHNRTKVLFHGMFF